MGKSWRIPHDEEEYDTVPRLRATNELLIRRDGTYNQIKIVDKESGEDSISVSRWGTNDYSLYVQQGGANRLVPVYADATYNELAASDMAHRMEVYVHDDFTWYVSPHHWTSLLDTGSVAFDNSLGTGGWLKLDTTNADTKYASIIATNAYAHTKKPNQHMTMRFKMAETANFKMFFGVSDTDGSYQKAAKNSVGIEIDVNNTIPANYYSMKNTAGVCVSADLNVAHVPAIIHTIELVWNSAGDAVTYILDGTTFANTLSTALPDVAAKPLVQIINSGGVATKDLFIDSFTYWCPRVE
jgi:hypothetical protein